jgi:enolase-phosphatase E1
MKLDQVQCVLLDIEGTVSDVRFVYDVMFPYAKGNMHSYLLAHWDSESTQAVIRQVATDASTNADDWLGTDWKSNTTALEIVSSHLQNLMASDSKATGLKMLQGFVWRSGFESGAIRAELFVDVLPALENWKASGLDLRIYSSGSVLAQKLFFAHTTQGDVGRLLTSYYDTTTGKKQEAESYRRIAIDIGVPANKVVFLSDVAEELIASNEAGMRSVGVVRPSNKPLPSTYFGPRVTTLSDLQLT